MGEIVAFFKSAYQVVKMIKEVVAMFKSVYAMHLKHESEKIKMRNTNIAKKIKEETLKKIKDQNNDELVKLLQERMRGV